MLVTCHSLAELPVAKETHMNLHFQREFPVKSECTFLVTAAHSTLPWLT